MPYYSIQYALKKWKIIPIFLIVIIGNAYSIEPIDTDGPDFVESSEVVPQGYIQYELDFGGSTSSQNLSQPNTTDTPLLIRYGISSNLEMRIQSDGFINQNGERGIGSTAFGLKYQSQMRNLTTGAPAIAWIIHFDTPIATPNYRTGGILPNLRSVITWDLQDDYSIGLMPGVGIQSNSSGETFTSGIFGAVLGKRLSSKFRVFIELTAPSISKPSQNGVITGGDVGAAYLLSNDTQLGFRAGLGLNNNSPKQYLLMEIAQRY